jgi:putative peptidoglycan lipid II flippase
VFVNTALATAEATGAVSWLNYAFRLMYLPIGLFGVSIATATLPAVSRQAGLEDKAAVRRTISDGLSLMLMLNVPAMVGLIVLGAPIVRVIFERGAFTPDDTRATAAALQFYAIGLVGYSVVRITSPVFYALGRSRTPVAVSVATVLLNAALNLALVRLMGYRGLALGTSLAALANAGLLTYLLQRHLDGLEFGTLISSFVRIALASAVMGGTVYAVDALLARWMPGGFALEVLGLGLAIGAGVASLAAAATVLRIPQFTDAARMISRRLRRTPR